MDIGGWVALIIGMIIAIILSIIFFTITLFIVKAAADIVFGNALISADFATLTAGIITVGSMLGGGAVLSKKTV